MLLGGILSGVEPFDCTISNILAVLQCRSPRFLAAVMCMLICRVDPLGGSHQLLVLNCLLL